MNLRHLRTFVEVARSGTVTAASSVLHIAQPALSRQLHALEADLGATLFHRSGHGMKVTPAGQALADDAERLLAAADEVRRRARQFSAVPRGEARIGLSPTMGRRLAISLVEKAAAAFPDVRLVIAEALSGTLLEWLHAGRIDAAILYHQPSSRSLISEVLTTEALSLIAGHADDLPEGAVPFDTLDRYPLLLTTSDHALRRMIDGQAADSAVKLDVAFELDSLEAIIALVRRRMALTILPVAALAEHVGSGVLVARPIAEPRLVRPVVLATGAKRALALDPSSTRELIREALQSTEA